MPTGEGISGYASVHEAFVFVASGAVAGDASVDDSALALGLGGDASVDNGIAQAWLTREWARVRVVLDGTDVLSLVGTVEWEYSRDAAAHHATFTIADERVAYAHASSFSTASLPVKIYRYTANRAANDEVLVFSGRTEAPSNTEPILPTGTFRCVSDSAAYDEARACVRYAAYAGKTRAEILAELATSIGLAVDIPSGWGTTVVQKPVEYVNVSVFEVARRFCEIEGGWPRGTIDGGLEIVPESLVYGPPVFVLDESNSFTPTEEPPARPATRMVLSTTTISGDFSGEGEVTPYISESIQGGTTGGKAWETRTVMLDSGNGFGAPAFTIDSGPGCVASNGAQVMEVTEWYNTFAILGTTTHDEDFQLQKREVVRTWYGAIGYQGRTRLSQILKRETTTEEWYSPLAPKDAELWTDGSHHVDTDQTFQTTRVLTEIWTWRASDAADLPCTLQSLVTTLRTWKDPLDGGITGTWARDGNGVETYTEDTSVAYDDGFSHLFASLTNGPRFGIESVTTETWTEQTFAGRRTVKKSIPTSGYTQTSDGYRGAWIGSPLQANQYGPVEEYGDIGTFGVTYTQSAAAGKYDEHGVNADGSYYSKEMEGEVPDIPRSDGETPAYQQDVQVLDVSDGAGTYPYNVESETIVEAESLAELEAIFTRRNRQQRAVRHTIPLFDEKWLAVGASVSETDRARVMTAWVGPVERLRVSVSTLSGMGEAEIVAALEAPV